MIYSNQPVNPSRLAYMRLLASEQDSAASAVREYRDFYDGDQGAMLTTRLAEFLNVSSNTSFAVNLCTLVVNSLAERLAVRGFATSNADLDDLLQTWWQQNRMDNTQAVVHASAMRDGQSFVIVDWDESLNRPTYYVNDTWDGYEGVKIHWSGKPGMSPALFASKRWRETFDEKGDLVTRRRLNLYFPDRVEHFIASGDTASEAGWMPYGDEPVESWLHPRTGKPLGIPVVPFLNQRVGRSELADVLTPQMALNKAVLDILAAADVEGFGIYTKTGGGFVETPYVAPGAFWQDTDPAAAFGKIGAGTVSALLEVYWLFCKTVAIVTRRPLSLFVGYASGDSGESLKEREGGLVAQAQAATVYYGNSWEDVAGLSLRLADAFGSGMAVPEDLTISAQWADIEVRNDAEHRASLRADFQAGLIDREYFWQEAGISEEDQEAMTRRMQAKDLAMRLQMEPQSAAKDTDKEQDGDTERPESDTSGTAPGVG